MECFRFDCCKNPPYTGKCDSCMYGGGFELKYSPEELEKAVDDGTLYVSKKVGLMGENGIILYPNKEYKVTRYYHIESFGDAQILHVESELGPMTLCAISSDDLKIILK